MSNARNISSLSTVEVGATADQTKSDIDALGIAALAPSKATIDALGISASSITGALPTALALSPTSDATFASIRGPVATTATTSMPWNNWRNMIQLSALDSGYTYMGESYIPGYRNTSYSMAFLFRTSYTGTGTTGLTFLHSGSHYDVQITGGWVQCKEHASGGTNAHVMTVRKLFKDVQKDNRYDI